MNKYIFLDESGDLGFNPKKKNSKYFIVTILFTSDKRPLEKIAKKIHGNLRKSVKKVSGGVLHAVKEKPATRKRVLRSVANKECNIMLIWLDKSKVYSNLQNEKHILYNYVVNILLDRIMSRKYIDKGKPIILVAAKRETSKFLNLNFKKYLQSQLKDNHDLDLNIEIKYPGQEKALQIVDFISWSVFRKYETGDDTYYIIIKPKIKEERGLFS